jgi:tetratricopeptide (TPR) repeat protein
MFKNTIIFEPPNAGQASTQESAIPLALGEEDRVWLAQKGVTILNDLDAAVAKIMSGQFLIVCILAENLTPETSKFLRLCQKNLGVLPQWQIIVGSNPSFELQAFASECTIKNFWPSTDLRKTLAPWILEQNKQITDKTDEADRSLRIGVAIAQGRLEVIEKSLEALKTEANFDFRVAFHLGVYYERVFRPDLSLQYFSKSLELNSKYIPAIYQCAQKLLENGRAAEAIKSFERLEMINPKNPDRKALMAQAYADTGDWDKAKACSTEAASLEPDNIILKEFEVRAAFESGDTQSALAALDSCTTTNDYFIKKLNAEAVKLSQNEQTEDAIKLYNKAWNIAPDILRFRISYNIALAHYRGSKFDLAAEFCARAESECSDPTFDKIAKLKKVLSEKVAS